MYLSSLTKDLDSMLPKYLKHVVVKDLINIYVANKKSKEITRILNASQELPTLNIQTVVTVKVYLDSFERDSDKDIINI